MAVYNKYDYDNIEQKEQEKITRALKAEADAEADLQAEIEAECEADNDLDILMSEAPEQKKTKRELERAALEILEKNAVTVQDFEKVLKEWNRLDRNRERNERRNEVSRGDNVPLEYGKAACAMYFPRNLNNYIESQLRKGEFEDAIFDSPEYIHELVTSPYLSKILNDLKADQKEILFLSVVKDLSPQEIAVLRQQTDRNIRKRLKVIYNKIHKKAYEFLTSDKAKSHDFTAEERKFVEEYRKEVDKSH